MNNNFIKINTNDKPDDYGFYYTESNGIRNGYIGTKNHPVLYKEEKEDNGKTISRTKGLSMGCFWSNWN